MSDNAVVFVSDNAVVFVSDNAVVFVHEMLPHLQRALWRWYLENSGEKRNYLDTISFAHDVLKFSDTTVEFVANSLLVSTIDQLVLMTNGCITKEDAKRWGIYYHACKENKENWPAGWLSKVELPGFFAWTEFCREGLQL